MYEANISKDVSFDIQTLVNAVIDNQSMYQV